MTFVLLMAARELRASWHRLLLFFLCIAIGVASIVSLRSFTELLKESILREARVLMASDVRVGSAQPWTSAALAALDRAAHLPAVDGWSDMLELQTMTRRLDGARRRPVLVEVRAVRDDYPLYGQIVLRGGAPYHAGLLADRGVVVSARVLARLEVNDGDEILIGGQRFRIRGVFERVPGNGLNFSPIPRVLVNYDDIVNAGLTKTGSRVWRSRLYRTVRDQDQTVVDALRAELKGTTQNNVSSFRFIEGWLQGSSANIEGFLGLIGLSMLVLGGVGIASVTRLFIEQKIKTIAILKCLGGRNSRVLGTYLLQVVLLSMLGSAVGVVLAIAILASARRTIADALPFSISLHVTPAAMLEGVGVGLLVALLFSVPSLLEIRNIKPNLILRHDREPRRRFDWVRIGIRVWFVAGLALLVLWEAGTYRRAWVMVAGVTATAVVLNLAGVALMWLLRRTRHVPWFAVRQGVGSLQRPGNQTRTVLFAVGVASLLLIAVRLQQVTTLREYNLDLSSVAADMVLIDIQSDQREGVATALQRAGARDMRFTPIVRARLVDAEWTPRIVRTMRVREQTKKRLGGEYRVSFRDRLEDHERVVNGAFWDRTPSTEPEISVSTWFATLFALEVGDRLVFEVQGTRINALVSSIRDLGRSRPGSLMVRFDLLFRPGTLDSAPHVLVGTLKGPADDRTRAEVQNLVLDSYPNITVVDALDDIAELRRRIGDLSNAVSILGGFVFLCGVLLLAGSVAMTKMQRIYEAAILKTLGARRKVIVQITLVEYGVLGLLAGVIGSAGAIAVTWSMSTFAPSPIPWRFVPSINIAGALITAVLVAAVGVMASWEVMARKPLGVIRENL